MSVAAELGRMLAPFGLIVRGGFATTPGDGLAASTVLLIGNVGGAMWRAFARAGDMAGPDPLDRWSRRILDAAAARFDAEVVMPGDGPPYAPFISWAMRAEPVRPSPLGILIHPDYGLWHAYRGALLFARAIDLPPPRQASYPCETCADKPCLSACPVDAFAGEHYDVAACRGHIAAPAGAACMQSGCAARRACPVGRDWRYEPAQASFHMRAFLAGVQEG